MPTPGQPRLLVLRPEPGCAATVARAAALGFIAVGAPLFTVAPVAWSPPDPAAFDALMLTSAHAVRHAGAVLDRYRRLPVYTVGEVTAGAARDAGFADVRPGSGDASALLDLMTAQGVENALHLAGREHRKVAHPALTVTRRIVYAAEPVAILPDAARVAIAAGAIALLHSPRAASVFGRLVEDSAAIRIAAISSAAAQAAGRGWQAVAIASAPTDNELLKAATTLS